MRDGSGAVARAGVRPGESFVEGRRGVRHRAEDWRIGNGGRWYVSIHVVVDVSEMGQWRGGRSKDLVLRGEFFQFTFEPLVVCEEGGRVGFEAVQFDFQVFDMTLFSFAKGSLAEAKLSGSSGGFEV